MKHLVMEFALLTFLTSFIQCFQNQNTQNTTIPDTITPDMQKVASYYSKNYPNLFTDLLGKSSHEVQNKIDKAWAQLFYGDENSQRVYYPVDPDMAYIKDTYNKDIRSEGMSYGMMIAVQLNKKEEFDRMWKWAKTFMQHKDGQRKNYFAWQMNTDGKMISPNPAPDGEEYFATALFFAASRWGNGTGIFNYKAEAQAILDAALNKKDSAIDKETVTNIFSIKEKQVVFVPVGRASKFTDPSYHLPHFYELWARWADKNNQFWCSVAATSRNFLKKAAHPVTGLTPNYSYYNGKPIDPWNTGMDDFRHDAWRVAMNIAVDYIWFGKDKWAITESNKILDFFYNEGLENYVDQYTLDGIKLSENNSPGLIAMNAVAGLASTNSNKIYFVKALWELSIPDDDLRYYNGTLYMMALLHVSGNFKIYDLDEKPVSFCSE